MLDSFVLSEKREQRWSSLLLHLGVVSFMLKKEVVPAAFSIDREAVEHAWLSCEGALLYR
jgi:hypothetical protein